MVYRFGIDFSCACAPSNVAWPLTAGRFAVEWRPKAHCISGCSEHRNALSRFAF